MSIDASRFSFHPWKDYFGVVMQQGRVQLDSDWNEWVAELQRRIQAGTMDTVGRAVVPRTTPDGFRIAAVGGELTIGRGRIYVDGLLAENHGVLPPQWDPALAELTGTGAVSFFAQPYLPFNAASQTAPANVFNRPTLAGGPHLVYLDVWQRDVTHWQDPDLIEKAVGVDTTTRQQTVWQVRLLSSIGSATCATPDGEVPGWADTIRPSGARLSTSTGDVPGDPNPCEIPPAAGYKGLENQLYRVEIHRGGTQANATFKWSRDDATVATRVSEIQGGNRLVVESIGRDEVLGFHAGEWIEILDDWHELHGRPGVLRRIRPGDGVDSATRSILLEDALPAGLFPVDGQGRTAAARRTRVRRWDQGNIVRRANGTEFHNLNLSASSEGIPLPPAGTKLALENGILVDFSLVAGGAYKTGDYWVFAARVADGSIEALTQAPPRGIHHHYARLATVTFPDTENDCRVMWPPEATGESCDCTVCVDAEGHNSGAATIDMAIQQIGQRGGTICLDIGTYHLKGPLKLDGVRSLRIRGQGWLTVLRVREAGGALAIRQGIGVAIENLAIVGVAARGGTTAMIAAHNCVDLQLDHLAVAAFAEEGATSAAVGLTGVILGTAIRECTFVAEVGILGAADKERPYLLTGHVRIEDNVLICRQRGLSFMELCLHYGELRMNGNLLLLCQDFGIAVTGGALPAASVTIAGNILNIAGAAILGGTDGLRITDNEIVGLENGKAEGIGLVAGLDKGPIDHAYITGNRISGLVGGAIVFDKAVGQAMVKSNVVERVTGPAIRMNPRAGAAYLCIENNHFSQLGLGFNSQSQLYAGIQLIDVQRGDVVGNVFGGVARTAAQSPLRAALISVSASELRIAGNRMFGVGPANFIGRTICILTDPGFARLAIDDNTLGRAADAGEDLAPAAWQAIAIGVDALRATSTGAAGSQTLGGVTILPLKADIAYLSHARIQVRALAANSLSINRNTLRGQSTLAPLVQVDSVTGCRFDHNDGEISSRTPSGSPPIGHIAADHAGASDNRMIAPSDSPVLQLTTKKFVVLGNLSSGPIFVNGSSLPAPWSGLNVQL